MNSEIKYTGIVLAGGKSRRMGKDKSMVITNGKPMIEHVINALHPFCNQILVCSADRVYPIKGVQFVEDAYPESGPLAGLEAGLRNAINENCIVLPCDTPYIEKYVIEQLILHHQRFNNNLIVSHDGKLEPLIGIYQKNIWPETKRLLENGLLKMQRFVQDINANTVVITGVSGLKNINQPEDLPDAD